MEGFNMMAAVGLDSRDGWTPKSREEFMEVMPVVMHLVSFQRLLKDNGIPDPDMGCSIGMVKEWLRTPDSVLMAKEKGKKEVKYVLRALDDEFKSHLPDEIRDSIVEGAHNMVMGYGTDSGRWIFASCTEDEMRERTREWVEFLWSTYENYGKTKGHGRDTEVQN